MAEAAEAMEEEQQVAAPAGPPGVLRDRFTIRSNQPLPEFSTPNAEAFVAEDKRDPKRALYALICRPDMPVRVNVMRALKGMLNPGLVQLVEWGAMTWSPAGRQCMTVIYERPIGKRLMAGPRSPECRRVDEYDISRKVVEPLVAAIKELTNRGITHRSIRASNLFFMDEGGERIALGDCATAPPAYDQPMAFETVESGMANNVARGSGSFSDDLYSLGVTLVFLLLGRNPVAHMDDEALLKMKIQQGSYSTLVGDERLPLAFIELLRGLLCDDPDQRWDIESLDLWLSGRRLSPLQQRHEKRAARGFPFNGKEYLNCRELAAAMSRSWDLAIPPVLEGKLELWLRRAVEDKERAQAVADVVRMALNGGDKRVVADLMLCKVLIMLDPTAPIRYKGFNSMPDGVGSALAAVMAQKGDTKLLAEVILREVPRLWFEARKSYLPDNSLMDSNFKELKGYLTQTGLGFGLERCLYEMNDALPCQSTLLGEEYIVELKELLPALNAAAAKRTDSKQWPVDRHVAAFMGARARSDIDRNLVQLNDSEPSRSLMALLNLFAVFQYRLGPEQLPNLAAWVGALAQPAVAAFHSREKRKELEKELPKLVRRGSVVEIYNLLDNPGERDKDQSEFAWAQAQYQAAEEEIRRVQNNEDDRGKEAVRIGKQTAAVTGIVIALLSTTITVIMKVW
ncbi:MAG: hypothetical protein H7Y60_02860 [Rhodospirillaceae bacterium]|nr:hypothetical protein [Rhodospirillales bacterium]